MRDNQSGVHVRPETECPPSPSLYEPRPCREHLCPAPDRPPCRLPVSAVAMLGFNEQVRQSWWMNYKHLSMEERYTIAAMRGQRVATVEIARALGRHRSTVYREVRRNCSAHDGYYRATHSVQKASARKHRSRRNLRYGTAQMAAIEERLRADWSPEQIVGSLRQRGQEVMSHETIYRHIWRDKAAGGSLWLHLRGASKQRRKRYAAYDSRGRLAGKRMIEQRPAIVDERRRIGDWEIDTVLSIETAVIAFLPLNQKSRGGANREK